MAQISINTPQGVQHGMIDGDTPTQEEWDRIKKQFGEDFEYTIAGRPQIEEKEEVEESVSLPTGEVKDNWLRFMVGRMDTLEEKENLLNQILGADAVRPDAVQGLFVIDQSKVSPEIRQQYNLGDSGEIYFDKPGFTWQDLSDFGGEAGPATLAAIGTSLAVTGFAWLPGMLMVGGAAALAKAIDESIEYAQGLNRQSAGEVATMIATEGALNFFFEGGGRLAAYGLGRLFKGRGPEVSQKRVEELIAAGRSPDKAFREAREESLASMRAAIQGGARPTIEAAAGKSLAARALSINEKIVPNKAVGRDNLGYINKVLKDLDQGVLSEKEALRLLSDNNAFVGNLVKQSLANPDEALKLSRQHFDDIVSAELKRYKDVYVPGEKLPEQYVDSLALNATLFRTESDNLYDIARTTLDVNGTFNAAPIRKTLRILIKDNPFIEYSGTLFKKLLSKDKEGNFVFDKMNIGQLQQLKSALRLSAGDPDLVAPAAQAGIGRLINSVDEILQAEQIRLGKIVSDGFEIKYHPAGAVDPKTGAKIGGRAYRQEVAPAELDSIRTGLSQWDDANKFWGEGQEQYNNAAVNRIVKRSKEKFFNSNNEVLRAIVEPGNVPKLKMYLDAITPSSVLAQRLVQPGATEALEQLQKLVIKGNFKQAEKFIDTSGLKGAVPKIEGFIEELPIGDVLRVSQRKAYEKEIANLIEVSRAGSSPQMIRESVRNSLAKEWVEQTSLKSQTVGKFDPTKFADDFSKLGEGMQNTLFGAEAAATMREGMDAFRLVGLSEKAGQGLFDYIPRIANQPLKNHVQALKEIAERGIAESDDAVLGAIKTGKYDNSAKLVAGLLNKPSSYNRLKAVIGETELEKVGGVKDMVMNNLVRASLAKEGFSEATVQSGAWGKALKKNIISQNKYGALDTILGTDVVESLTKLADDAVKVSDAPIAGYSGIAGPLAALAIIAAIPFNISAALGALGTALVIGRVLRSRPILRLVTQPVSRSRDYNKAIKAGADLPSLGEVFKSTPLAYAANRLGSVVASETALILGSGILGEIIEESRREGAKSLQEGVRDLQRQPTTGVPQGGDSIYDPINVPSPLTYEEMIKRAAQSGNVPGAEDVLRRIEEGKLLGGMRQQ